MKKAALLRHLRQFAKAVRKQVADDLWPTLQLAEGLFGVYIVYTRHKKHPTAWRSFLSHYAWQRAQEDRQKIRIKNSK